jgi:oxalate---CoA ligase
MNNPISNSANSIFDLIQRRAIQAAHAVAIASPQAPDLSYQQLWHCIDQTTAFLTNHGINRGDRIALVLPNGPEAAIAFLAVSSSAIAAPLNPNYQAAEFQFYLEDLNAKAVILLADDPTPARQVAEAMGIAIFTLTIHPFQLAAPTDKTTALRPFQPPQPQDIALILHTSGTTSRPKIVPLTHQNLLQSAQNVADTLQLEEGDRALNVMPLFHIHGLVASLLASLHAGGSVVCTPGFQSTEFFNWIATFQPSWYSAVPTIHQAVLAAAPGQEAIVAQYPLRFLRSSSAALMPKVMEALETLFQTPVIEAYGMTEAAHQMTSNPLPPRERKPRSVGLAGKTQVAIAHVTEHHLLPQGAIGEVVIRGVSVIAGYENNPNANETSFFDGWFRTGDQGYLDGAGYLFLAGRLKEMINRGGEKIVPLEIDEALMAMPEVQQAVAFALPHPSLGEDLAAAVVLAPGSIQTPETLRDYLFSTIAPFKVPSQILILPSIPKGPTGKLQRIGLAQQLAEPLKLNYVAPRNPTESAIAKIIAEVLDIQGIGVEDNFFAIGGDSLKGTQVMSRLETFFNLPLSNVLLFQRPTVEQLASKLAELQVEESSAVQDLVSDLEKLSPEEVELLLREME